VSVFDRWRSRRGARAAQERLRLGNRSLDGGDLPAAAAHYAAAVEADPGSVDARVNLGFVLLELGRPHDAVEPLRHAVAHDPDSADGNYLLGSALLALARRTEAIGPLLRATVLRPALEPAWRDAGRALAETGRIDDAEATLRAGIAVHPGTADLHHHLGNVLAGKRRTWNAIEAFEDALKVDPGHVGAWTGLAPARLAVGDVDGSLAASRAALDRAPGFAPAESNLLLALSADPTTSPARYLLEANRIGDARAARAGGPARRFAATPTGRLRVGFVSGDLRSHPVGYFLEPLLGAWDASRMDAIAYSTHPSHDALTDRLRGGFRDWRDAWALDDAALAARIADDRVDVLVDLSGHTPDNRLGVFARRAAPVQVAWLGYWASTGLPTVDAVLADPVSLPPALEAIFRERVVRLPVSRLCFGEPAGSPPAVAPPPSLRPGATTVFGSFQRLAKITDATVRRWRDVLAAVPGSTLRLQAFEVDEPRARRVLLDRCARLGLDAGRLVLVPGMRRADYLAAHAEVDILLDTTPHSGATTTCEALWMGVPTLTVAGASLLERQSASLLHAAGLGDWVAQDEGDLVRRAVAFAADRASLARLRAGLRDAVRRSPLMDAPAFAAAWQDAVEALAREPSGL
jgi:protein O-GlcNAc transferase